MGTPQIIIIVLTSLSLFQHLSNHGKQMEIKYNFFMKLISQGIFITLLLYGGFFS